MQTATGLENRIIHEYVAKAYLHSLRLEVRCCGQRLERRHRNENSSEDPNLKPPAWTEADKHNVTKAKAN